MCRHAKAVSAKGFVKPGLHHASRVFAFWGSVLGGTAPRDETMNSLAQIVGNVEAVLSNLRAASIPPVSNTGGKFPGVDLVDLNLCERGRYDVSVDTLTLSFSGSAFGYDVSSVRHWLSRWSENLSVGGPLRARYNGYNQCYDICTIDALGESPSIGWLGVSLPGDNMRGRWCLHLTAVGCAFLRIEHYQSLIDSALLCELKITRIDIAVDDLFGDHSVKSAFDAYASGAYGSGGRMPKSQYLISSHGSGDTFYVGRRESGKLLRVYDKGKQLGDPGSSWVRHEVEIRSEGRVIPLNILLNPGSYFLGAYPKAHAWFKASNAAKVLTNLVKKRITIDLLLKHARQQCGRIVRYCAEKLDYSSDEIVASVISLPGRLPVRLFDPVEVDYDENFMQACSV